MKLNSTVSDEPIDELYQIRDELRVVWLALGNETDEGYHAQVREHINGITNRISDIVEHLCGERLAQASKGGQRNG